VGVWLPYPQYRHTGMLAVKQAKFQTDPLPIFRWTQRVKMTKMPRWREVIARADFETDHFDGPALHGSKIEAPAHAERIAALGELVRPHNAPPPRTRSSQRSSVAPSGMTVTATAFTASIRLFDS